MVDIKRMRELYKGYNYTDEQLIKIRDFLYDVAKMQSQMNSNDE